MLNVVLFLGFSIGFLVSCDDEIILPKGEVCFDSKETYGKLLCENTNFAEGSPEREYDRFIGQKRNGSRSDDIITNKEDYFKFRTEFIETKKKLIICQKYPDKCVPDGKPGKKSKQSTNSARDGRGGPR